MSTLQNRAIRHRHGSAVGAAWFALGLLIAVGVGFVILSSAKTTQHAVTLRYHPACSSGCLRARLHSVAPAQSAAGRAAVSHTQGSAASRLVVDPGSGFAVDQGGHAHGGIPSRSERTSEHPILQAPAGRYIPVQH